MPVARLAMVNAENRAESLPFVFVRLNDALYSPIDGKPKSAARLKRLEIIEQHPQVQVLLDHYASNWQALWWLKLDGEARAIGPDHACWSKLEAGLRLKYPQYETTPLFAEQPTAIEIKLGACRWWGYGGEASLTDWLKDCAT